MLDWPEVRKAVGGLLGRISDSPFETLGRFTAWLGMSFEVARQWESRGVAQTTLSRLLAEASRVPLTEWIHWTGKRERLHEDSEEELNAVWATGLTDDIGINPWRVASWAKDEELEAEERLAIILCLSREHAWARRYGTELEKRLRRRPVPAEHSDYLEALRQRRVELNYTQAEIGVVLGSTRSMIASWESGIRGFNWHRERPTIGLQAYAALLERLEPNDLEREAGCGPRVNNYAKSAVKGPTIGEDEAQAERIAEALERRRT